jgi:hypothetical protein
MRSFTAVSHATVPTSGAVSVWLGDAQWDDAHPNACVLQTVLFCKRTTKAFTCGFLLRLSQSGSCSVRKHRANVNVPEGYVLQRLERGTVRVVSSRNVFATKILEHSVFSDALCLYTPQIDACKEGNGKHRCEM